MEYKEDTQVTRNRFDEPSKSLCIVRKEIHILEEWLNVHPFPKYKHASTICGFENSH